MTLLLPGVPFVNIWFILTPAWIDSHKPSKVKNEITPVQLKFGNVSFLDDGCDNGCNSLSMLGLTTSSTTRCIKPSGLSFLPRIGSLLCRVHDTIRLVPIRFDGWFIAQFLGCSAEQRVAGLPDTLGPAFEAGIPHIKQFAHNWYSPCCQCSHVSSIHKNDIHKIDNIFTCYMIDFNRRLYDLSRWCGIGGSWRPMYNGELYSSLDILTSTSYVN